MTAPEIGKVRLVELGGARRLALDVARAKGDPVAVVGPNAVGCRRCGAEPGDRCLSPRRAPLDYPHFERVAAMNVEIERLLAEEGK